MDTRQTSTLERHTAVPQISGYLYQIQCALLRFFDLQEGETLGIEVLDDLHIEQNGIVTELDQYKYHSPEQHISLGDSSPELWKTLGTWAAAIADKSLDLSTVQLLVLITRAKPSSGSIVEIIANNNDRNDAEITEKLLAVPYSKDKQLLKSFNAVHALPKDLLYKLFKRLRIYTQQPSLTETFELLRSRLRQTGFHQTSLDDALEHFCGWIWKQVLLGLESSARVLISEESFHKTKCLIRDEFTANRLYPRYANIDPNNVDEAELARQIKRNYIIQLSLVGASTETRHQSMIDYFRATRERSDWIDKGEILPDQLISFDRELVDRWRREFDMMCDEITEQAIEEDLRRLGLKHFRNIQRIDVPIQPGWIHSYLTSGSYQALADKLCVGWHPHFQKLLSRSISKGG